MSKARNEVFRRISQVPFCGSSEGWCPELTVWRASLFHYSQLNQCHILYSQPHASAGKTTRTVFNRKELFWGVDFLSQKRFVQSVLAVMDKPSKIKGEEQLVPGKEMLIAAKCNRSLGLQIAAVFCILEVPYRRSIQKAAHGTCVFYRTSAFMGIITLSIYCRVCLHMFKFYGKSSLTVSSRCGWVRISICHQTPSPQPEGDFSHLLIQECCGQLVRKSWPSAASPPSPAWLAASVPSSLDLHPLSSNCHFRFKLRDVSSHTPKDMHGGMDKAVLLREWFSYSAQQWWSRGLCGSSSVLITSCYSHQCVSQSNFRLVHSGPGKGSPQSGVDLSFATRTGTRQGIETHLFRTETSRDLSLWTRSIVQGCHNSAELITEITTCE